jgi:iron complex transport system substrate-binding protein
VEVETQDSSIEEATIEASTQDSTSESAEQTSESTTDIKETSFPLAVENYSIVDGVWQTKEQTFQEVPQHVVATTQPTAELLIRLGLTDKMVGVAALYGETAADLTDEFAKIPVLSSEYVGKEPVLGANPDLVIGRGDLFADADWGVGTVEELNGLGITTFILNTCQPNATLDNLYKDIEQLGEIFNVQEKAAEFSESLHARAEQLESSLTGEEKLLTYAYISVTDGAVSVYSGSTDSFQNNVLNLIKLDNAFKDATGEINLEQFIATDPDILLISYYKGGPDTAQAIEDLYAIPAIQSMNAIKNKQAYVIDYNQFWAYGYQIFDGVEKLGSEIYPDLITLI